MGIVSSLFAKPVRKALTKSVAKQADAVVPKIASEVVESVVDTPLPSKSLVTRKARGASSKPVVKEEPVVAPQDDVDTGVNFDPLFREEEAAPTPVVDDAFMSPKVDSIEDFGVEPELIADSGTDAFEALGLSAEKKEAWRKENKASQRSKLLPEIEEAAQKLFEGKLKPEEFRKLSAEKQPIVPLDKVPDMPSFTDIAGALTEAQVNKGIVGLNMKIQPGERVSSRLDIPAYNDYNTWVVSLHEGTTKSGAPIGYAKTAVLKNVEFVSDPKVALDIARRKPLGSGGRMGKATIARIFGDYVPHNPDNAKAYAEKIFNDPEWTQVGMNPYRASYFYDKADNMPVISADEIVQIGPLVMAKNVKKTKPDDAIFRVNKKDDASPTFAKGGVVKNEMNKLFAEGGVMQEGGTVDPVSGNEVPPGAMAEEVRDDIDAKLSEGEFVFPADVVRFYGLEKLMMMRDKAKKGLQRMSEIGQMGNAEEVPDGEALFGDEMDDDSFSSEIDSIMSEDEGGETREYAEGGYVLPENEQLYRDAPVKGFEMVPMTNDAGQTIYIPFINGVAQLSIPSGYKVKAAGAAEPTAPVAAGPTTQTTPSGGDGGGSDGGGPVGGGGGSFGTDAPNPSSTHGGITTGSPVASTVGGIVGGLFGLTVGMPSLGVQAGKSLASSLSNSQAQAQTAEAIGFNLGVEGYSSQAVTAAQQAAQNASTQANATAGSIAAAGAQAAADVDGKDPMEAMMSITNAFGTGTSGTSVSEGENPSGGTNVTGTVNGETFGYTEAAPSTNTSTEGSVGVGPSSSSSAVGTADAASESMGGDGIGGAGTGVGEGGVGAGNDGGGIGAGEGLAKGGFVSKRKDKKTGKSTSFVTRQK